jgi:hypothetical protein
MRAHSALVASLALTLSVVATEVSAHRREDYLQTARIGVETDRVLITLDLTPGIAVAETFLAALDGDRDGALSADEEREYAGQVLRALEVELDERPLRPRLVSWRVAEPSAFRRGEGTIHLALEAAFPESSAGAHQLLFRNTHLPDHSVYLANALVPESARVAVTAQHRDRDQTELAIEYTVRADTTGATLPWIVGGLVAASVVARNRTAASARPRLRR